MKWIDYALIALSSILGTLIGDSIIQLITIYLKTKKSKGEINGHI